MEDGPDRGDKEGAEGQKSGRADLLKGFCFFQTLSVGLESGRADTYHKCRDAVKNAQASVLKDLASMPSNLKTNDVDVLCDGAPRLEKAGETCRR